MSRFIEVTDIAFDGRKKLINIDSIRGAYSSESHTNIVINGEKLPLMVKETYEEIKEMLINSRKENE